MLTFAFSGTIAQFKALQLDKRQIPEHNLQLSDEVGFCTNCKQIVAIMDVWEDHSDDGDGDEYQYSVCAHCKTATV